MDRNAMNDDACCAPSRPRPCGGSPASATRSRLAGDQPAMVPIGAGAFRMGSDDQWSYPADGEGPVHDVELDAFQLGAYAVRNDEFEGFVAATGYVSDAERFGWSFVFAGDLPHDFPPTRAVARAPWWRQVEGADWKHPTGPQSGIDGLGVHPVVHVSWDDAAAFCAWSGTRLPTEAEWEYGARGGREGTVFPWGDELEPGGTHEMNVFQGEFPTHDTGADGFIGTAPVDAFRPNGYGLYNMTGNVWEWCADWFDSAYYSHSTRRNPTGPTSGESRVMRGGSYLCHASYCRRYRVAARSANGHDSSTGNLGFRVAVAARSDVGRPAD